MVGRIEGHVFTGHTSFYLVPGVEFPKGHWPRSLTTDFLSAREDEVRVTSGTHTGDVPLITEAHDSEPPDEAGWEDVAEASVSVPTGELRVLESQMPLFGNLASSGPGDYRVRVLANHRGDERAGRGSHDAYLVQVWPAPRTPEKLVRLCQESRHHLEALRRARPKPPPEITPPDQAMTPPPEPRPMSAPGGPRLSVYESMLTDPITPSTED